MRSFDKHYQGELAYLRDMGRAFAVAHPSLAGLLGERGADPDVERLLEGFAFLAARLRQRIDDSMPDMVAHLVSILSPALLRPFPACTIVELDPPRASLRGRVLVPRGTHLASRAVDGTACSFRTTMPVELLPLTLAEQKLTDPASIRPALVLTLDVGTGGQAAVFTERGFRFHLHGELATASHLYLWLRRHCRAIRLTAGDTSVTLSPEHLVPVGFDPEDALVPWPRSTHDAHRLVAEAFTLPSKFLFFDLRGLDALAGAAPSRFEVRFEFDRPPPLPTRVTDDLVRLFATPAVNLFPCSADPVRGDGTSRPALLRASGLDPRHMEVFSVESVVGLVSRSGVRRDYAAFDGFAHTARREASARYYVLTREPSPVDDGQHAFLSLGTPKDVRPLLEEETLSIELTCTNRSLAASLRVGDVCVPTRETPAGLRFSNLGTVTKPTRPALGGALHDRLVAHLALSRSSTRDAATLRALLGLYDANGTDDTAARANRRRIDSILEITSTVATRVLRGGAVRGETLALTLDESGFASAGEAFLFADVLDRVLGAHAHASSFSRLVVTSHPSGVRTEWPARSGTVVLP